MKRETHFSPPPIMAHHAIRAQADNGTSGIFENRQKMTFKVADLLLLWSDSSQFNGV